MESERGNEDENTADPEAAPSGESVESIAASQENAVSTGSAKFETLKATQGVLSILLKLNVKLEDVFTRYEALRDKNQVFPVGRRSRRILKDKKEAKK